MTHPSHPAPLKNSEHATEENIDTMSPSWVVASSPVLRVQASSISLILIGVIHLSTDDY